MIDVNVIINKLDNTLTEIQRIEYSTIFSDASVQAAREARKVMEELIRTIKAHE